MARIQKSTTVYPHPFSAAYWQEAANELKDTRMLVITALLIAIRIALKPFAIPLGHPQLTIQVATLATALGAMIFGPVVAIPAAFISDTIGFMIHPTGDYFLPFALTEIAGTMIYALFLYRSEVNPVRVMLSRFSICLFVNVILQQLIMSWQYVYMGNPEEAMDAVMGIMEVTRIFKNLAFFPIETVVLTLFLKVLLPVVQRAKLVYCKNADLTFNKKQIAMLVALVLVGAVSATAYLGYRYTGTSRTADFSTEERVETNKEMARLITDRENSWKDETVVCVVDSAYRGLFQQETDYTVSVYILDEEAFAAGQAQDSKYTMETLWAYSKSGPKKDQFQSLIKVAEVTFTRNEETDFVSDYKIVHLR